MRTRKPAFVVSHTCSLAIFCWLPVPALAPLNPPCLPPGLPDCLQEETLALEYVIAKGEVVKTPEWVRGGMFERGPGIRPRQPPVS